MGDKREFIKFTSSYFAASFNVGFTVGITHIIMRDGSCDHIFQVSRTTVSSLSSSLCAICMEASQEWSFMWSFPRGGRWWSLWSSCLILEGLTTTKPDMWQTSTSFSTSGVWASLIFSLASSVHFVRRRFWATSTESQRSRPNRPRTKWTEHASKNIRPLNRSELYIFQIDVSPPLSSWPDAAKMSDFNLHPCRKHPSGDSLSAIWAREHSLTICCKAKDFSEDPRARDMELL